MEQIIEITWTDEGFYAESMLIELSPEHLTKIKEAQKFLKKNTGFHSVTFTGHGVIKEVYNNNLVENPEEEKEINDDRISGVEVIVLGAWVSINADWKYSGGTALSGSIEIS